MRAVPVLAALALSLVAATAVAQSNPSSDDILNALKPKTLSGTTRGIRPAKPAGSAEPATPAAAAAPPVSATAPAANSQAAVTAPADAPSVNLTVQFATGSAQLTPAAMHTLDALGRALSSKELADYRFRIEGHTDTVGRPDKNLALSQARASAVVAYLTSKYNVPSGHLEAVGRGSQSLLVQTPDQTAEPRNRRVQVINLGA